MTKKKSNLILLIMLAVIIIVMVVSVLWFNTFVFSELEISARTTLREMAEEEVRAISLIVGNMEQSMLSIIEVIKYIGHDYDDMYLNMTHWEQMYNISALMITDIQGSGISSKGSYVNIADGAFLDIAYTGQVGVTEVYESELTNDRVIAAVAPIYYEDEIQGVIVAEYCVEYLAAVLSDSTDSRGSSMIVNGEGEIMLHTYPFEISFENFKSAQFEDGKSYISVLDDFSNNLTGNVTFSIGGDRKLGEYLPVEVLDWTLFLEISESDLSSSANTITEAMVLISIGLILAFGLLITYILMTRKANLRQIEKVAYYDKLTGISNLVKFKIDVESLLKEKRFDSSNYVLVKSDLSNFKAINEVYGFQTGNKVIKQMAKFVSDIDCENLRVARTGTDELIVFADNESIERHLLSEDVFVDSLREHIPEVRKHIFNFRYGRYFIEQDEKNIDEMVNKVSMAHSFAKAESGTIVWNYDEKFKQHLIRMTELTNKMRDALRNGEFKLFLQPKYSLESEQIAGAEALVRWIESDGKMIYPNEFIPLFEKNEFIVQLDKYMFERTCKLIRKRMDAGKDCIPISVNFSRLHFQNPNFTKELLDICEKYEVPPRYVEVELTETTIIENKDEVTSMLKTIRAAGISVSIDDFGSGHSSLGMLKDYEVDVVKLDRSFFSGEAESDESGVKVVESIARLIQNLGLKIVAEGIETKKQIELLKMIGCDYVQGYYYSKPMNEENFENLIDTKKQG